MELLAGFGEVGVVQSELKGAGKGDGWSPQAGFGAGGGEGMGKEQPYLTVEGGDASQVSTEQPNFPSQPLGRRMQKGQREGAFSTPTSTPSRPPIPLVPVHPPQRTGSFLKGRGSGREGCRLQNQLFCLFFT